MVQPTGMSPAGLDPAGHWHPVECAKRSAAHGFNALGPGLGAIKDPELTCGTPT